MSRLPVRIVNLLCIFAVAASAGGVARAAERGASASSTTAPASAASVRGVDASATWSTFASGFLERYYAANPDFAVAQGRHEFDGGLPDWTAAGLAREVARLRAERAKVAAFADAGLSSAERFERDYVLSRIDRDLFWLDVAKSPFRNPAYYVDALNPSVYVVRPYASPDVRARAFAKYARAVAKAAPEIRRNLKTPMPATYVKYGVAGFGGLADFFRKDVPLAFAAVKDPAVKRELAAAIEPAAAALDDLANWLKSEQARATGPDPLGPERYAQMLKMTEGVDVPLDRLEAVGRADLERNTKALREACAEFAPGATLRACVDRAAARKPAGGAVAGAREQLVELRRFVAERDVVTIPGPEEAQVAEAPAFNRQNFAYIEIPGPYEKNLPSVYYIAPPDPSWPKAEQDAYVPGENSLLFTSVHEVWPGHFLQFLHANRSKSMVGRVFVGYAFAEGWAHYTEEMMYDSGVKPGPEWHIGQLQQALLRNVRFLSSIGLHTRGMTVEQSERMFLDHALTDAGNARQQAARGTYDPAYLNYTLGKLMVRKLREDWTATHGGRAGWKVFHDAFLSYGGPPIPLVRRAMLPGDTRPAL
jgi:uncharacterized protein (DUF885 family)